MNDEELAALWEKLVGDGLSEDEADEHVRRAMMGEEPEKETSALQAGAMHAFDTITGISEDQPNSGYQGGAGGRQMRSPDQQARQNETTAARQSALATAEDEHPYASFAGDFSPLLLPGVGMTEGLAAKGMSLVRGGVNAAKSAGKGALGLARDAVMFGPNKFKNAANQAKLSTLKLAKKAAQEGTQAAPSVAGAVDEAAVAKALGVDPAKFTAGVGEAAVPTRAPARLARAKEMLGDWDPVAMRHAPSGVPPKAGKLAGAGRDQSHRPFGAGPEGGMETVTLPGRAPIRVPRDLRYAESILGETGAAEDALTKGARERVQRRRPFIETNTIEQQIARAKGKPSPPRATESNEARRLGAELKRLLQKAKK